MSSFSCYPRFSSFFSGYRYWTGSDEAECRASCLLEDTCLAVQYSTDTRGCKLLRTQQKKRAVDEEKSKIVIFLPRLQREKEILVFDDLKVKTDQQPRRSEKASNIAVCNAFCSHDAFCAAFVFCRRDAKSWCSSQTSKNCLLYSEQQVAAVEKDKYSVMYFVWKDYALATNNGRVQVKRRKRRVGPDERKDV